MRCFIRSLAFLALAALAGGAAFVYCGVFDVAATDHHSPPVRWLFEQARIRSVKAHAAGIAAPPGSDDQHQLLVGADHFSTHCAICHGAPGVPRDDIAEGLYPEPPDLAGAAARYSRPELFWILKNGIKMSGMPSWGDHSDEDLWAIVSFLEKLPGMGPRDYASLVDAAKAAGIHHHPAME